MLSKIKDKEKFITSQKERIMELKKSFEQLKNKYDMQKKELGVF